VTVRARLSPETRILIVLLALIGAAACSGTMAPSARPRPHKPATRTDPGAGVPALRSVPVPGVAQGSYGPYLALRDPSGILVWAGADDQGKRGWFSAALNAADVSVAQPLRLADAAADLELVSVEPASKSGYVVISSRAAPAVEFMLLGSTGALVGGPLVLAQPSERVLWIDAVATEQGNLALWAVARGDRADLFGQLVAGSGKPVGRPAPVARDAKAWQAVAFGGGVAVATVRAEVGKTAEGPVELALLDARGRPKGPPVVVSSESSAHFDLDLVSVGSHAVVAWTDGRALDSHVFAASVDEKGTVSQAPVAVTGPVGEQVLIRLVAPATPAGTAYMVWQELWDTRSNQLALAVAPIDGSAKLGAARASITAATDDANSIEFAAKGDALGVLTLSPLCRREQSCDGAPVAPTFVALDKKLGPIASEPLRVDAAPGSPAALGWGLACGVRACFGLAGGVASAGSVYFAELTSRSTAWQPAAKTLLPPRPPRVTAVQVLAEVDPLADVAVAKLEAGALAAWVTYFDPTTPYERLKQAAPDGRFEPLRALLQVRLLAAQAQDNPPAHTISLRARSLGGVALSPGDPNRNEALLGWTALDQAQPQVFLTLLGKDGRKTQQRLLTRATGEKSDVALEYTGDGWMVAWVDERDADPELYVAKVDRALVRRLPERRLTTSAGVASGPVMLARGKDVFLAWSDARGDAARGFSDIYVVKLKSSDASNLTQPERLVATPDHSHSPALAALGDAVAIAWVESNPEGVIETKGPGVQVGRLDGQGRFKEPPVNVAPLAGAATSVALSCESDRCRVVMSVDVGGKGELHTFVWQPGVEPKVSRLLGLAGPSNQSVAPALLGTALLYADQSSTKRGRVRRLLVEW
jgi:hypothetical protein